MTTTSQIEQQQPVAADFVVDQDWAARYTDLSHATWATLVGSTQPVSKQTACSKFLQGQDIVRLDPKRIPKFKDVSEQLADSTGWEIVGVSGFVPNEIFFKHFVNKRFPVSCSIRSLDDSHFEEYPDLFDEELEERILHETAEAYECEAKIIDWILGDYTGDKLTPDHLKNFVKDRLNQSLVAIGFKEVFDDLDKQLLEETEWFNEDVLGNTNTDFFYARPVNYSKGNKSYDVEDLF